MIAVPFIYFSLLTWFFYVRNKQFNLPVFTCLIYAVSSFFAILIDIFDLRFPDTVNYDISFFACFIYCALLTLCMIPIQVYANRVQTIEPVQKTRLLKGLAYVAGIYGVFFMLMSMSQVVLMLTSDMGEMRANQYAGEGLDGFMASWPRVIRLPFSLLNMIFGCPWISIFLAFFCLVIQKLPARYSVMYIIGSLMGPISGIIGADRSNIAYWILSLAACYVFFRPYMSAALKRKFIVAASILVVLFGLYLAAMTISRFEDRDAGDGRVDGTQGSLISYFGQSYTNFCYFFDTFETPCPTLEAIFPFTYNNILGIGEGGGVPLQQMLTDRTNVFLGVFYTFLGQIATTAGNGIAIAFCIFFVAFFISYLRRFFISSNTNLLGIYVYMACATVVYLGLFGHYYTSASHTFSLISFWIIITIMCYKIKL